MQKFTILPALAGLASATFSMLTTGDECCTIYSEKNMQGQQLDLCYGSELGNTLFTTTIFRLSEIDIDWTIASIACGDSTDPITRSGYTVC